MTRYPYAKWFGDKVKIKTPLMTDKPQGLILHITDGVPETDPVTKKEIPGGKRLVGNLGGLLATFNETGSIAHFGISMKGEIGQYIDIKFRETATEHGADWFSVECCLDRNRYLEPAQVQSAGNLFAWLHSLFPDSIPLKLADPFAKSGLAYHSLFLTAEERKDPKKHHTGCPGDLVISQRPSIINVASLLTKINFYGNTNPFHF